MINDELIKYKLNDKTFLITKSEAKVIDEFITEEENLNSETNVVYGMTGYDNAMYICDRNTNKKITLAKVNGKIYIFD